VATTIMHPEENSLPPLQVPENVRRVLGDFLHAAQEAFVGGDLLSVVLYGSAAEGRMRATSDVNVILVLARFDPAAGARLTEPLRRAEAAVRLRAMFLLEAEVADAAAAFALKFADLAVRHVVLFGRDFFSGLAVPREAKIFRLRQVLLNTTLRLREALVLDNRFEERLALLVAESAGPLRSAAATLRELENQPPASNPKAALEAMASELDPAGFQDALAALSAARADSLLPAGVAAPTLLRLIDLGTRLHTRASRLASGL
jgi:predicted nucleotidyltransferase